MVLKQIRKAAKVTIKDTGLNARTVAKIESGKESVSVKIMRQYLESIGLKLTYSL